jgi:ATP-dependent Zn protease
MPETTAQSTRLDLASIADPDVRRVLRQMHEQYRAILDRQQVEIEAILEMLIDKRLGSLGEFKLNASRLQEKNIRSERFHEAVLAAIQPAANPRSTV